MSKFVFIWLQIHKNYSLSNRDILKIKYEEQGCGKLNLLKRVIPVSENSFKTCDVRGREEFRVFPGFDFQTITKIYGIINFISSDLLEPDLLQK